MRKWDVATQKPRDILLNRDVSWKVCKPGRDTSLGDLDPFKLLNLANEMGSVTGYVTKMAYPRLLPEVATWSKVRDKFRAGDFGPLPVPLRKAIDAGQPIVVDHDPEGHGAQALVWGPDDIFHLEHNGDKTRKKPPHCKGLLMYQIFCWHHEKFRRGSEL
ncbi:unnamed protein product [Prorocentrum cordatum]|uniref:Uncharacterized protein n=1 Tax=Prorocentrum cordatum TaxID=2364126 RepID=A0ABN9YA46_9DINO|nr:unnamed protein product [Polarella glacialis]